MQIIHGGGRIEKFAIDGAGSDIQPGALMTFGVTDETDRGCAIISGAAAADALGVLLALHDFSVVGDSTPEDGAAYVEEEIEIAPPGAILAAEYSQDAADDIDVASATSTVVTITSLEDDIDGSWLYVVAGTGIGQLVYIKSSASGAATVKSAMGTTLDSTSRVIKILSLGHTLCHLTSDRVKLASQAAIGSARLNVLKSQVSIKGGAWEDLNPTKHHNLSGLNDGVGSRFRSLVTLADGFFAPID